MEWACRGKWEESASEILKGGGHRRFAADAGHNGARRTPLTRTTESRPTRVNATRSCGRRVSSLVARTAGPSPERRNPAKNRNSTGSGFAHPPQHFLANRPPLAPVPSSAAPSGLATANTRETGAASPLRGMIDLIKRDAIESIVAVDCVQFVRYFTPPARASAGRAGVDDAHWCIATQLLAECRLQVEFLVVPEPTPDEIAEAMRDIETAPMDRVG